MADEAAPKLTYKQRVFVEEYLQSWNATRAAEKAGYKYPNKQGPRLLVFVGVKTEIEKRIKEKAMPADEVLARLGEQARNDGSLFLTPLGVNLKELIGAGKSHLVKSVKRTEQGLVIEFYDAQAALVQLGKAHKLFTEQIDLTSEGESILKPFAELMAKFYGDNH